MRELPSNVDADAVIVNRPLPGWARENHPSFAIRRATCRQTSSAYNPPRRHMAGKL